MEGGPITDAFKEVVAEVVVEEDGNDELLFGP